MTIDQPFVDRIKAFLSDKSRAGVWLVVAAVGMGYLYVFAPFKLGVLVWMVTKMATAVFIGYWGDRIVFPYHRIVPPALDEVQHMPWMEGDEPLQMLEGEFINQDLWQLRRAFIILGCLIAAGLQA